MLSMRALHLNLSIIPKVSYVLECYTQGTFLWTFWLTYGFNLHPVFHRITGTAVILEEALVVEHVQIDDSVDHV